MGNITISRIAIVFVLFVLLETVIAVLGTRPLVFDSANWKSRPRLRGQMINSLLSKEVMAGKTRNEVVELLGN